jgi:hypothetical protein
MSRQSTVFCSVAGSRGGARVACFAPWDCQLAQSYEKRELPDAQGFDGIYGSGTARRCEPRVLMDRMLDVPRSEPRILVANLGGWHVEAKVKPAKPGGKSWNLYE